MKKQSKTNVCGFPIRLLKLTTLAIALKFSLIGAGLAAPPEGMSPSALQQIRALEQEKLSRSPTHRKLDSQFVFKLKQKRGQAIAQGVTKLRADIELAADGRVLVDIDAKVTDRLLAQIKQGGGTVINSLPHFHAIRALVTLDQLEDLAESAEVRFIQRAAKACTNTGSVTSEGDVTHRADVTRATVGVTGQGIKVGVLSDSVDYLAYAQASGDLGDVTVLPGQSGVPGSGEGTAMLEIIHDLAPDAQLCFATAFGSPASFAQNILDLRSNGCDIIVDDISYFNESPFQDDIIAQAVNTVTADGALYFSSAGNGGNKQDETSGAWEGDFMDGGPLVPPVNIGAGTIHSFGAATYNTVSVAGSWGVWLFWADPLGASTNDYDLFVLDPTGTDVVASSLYVQDGTQDPLELVFSVYAGERLVIVKSSGDARFLHLEIPRGMLTTSTSGAIRGHAAAAAAFGVAAVDASTSYPNPFSGGSQNPVESFSSDGPRRVFFNADGTPITPGNFSSTGGAVRQKPDIAAADGVMTYVFGHFFGTSAAAPHAAAIAALLWSYDRVLTPEEIRAALTSTALDIEEPGADASSGAGIVMAYEALQTLPPRPYIRAGGWTLVNEYCPNEAVDPGETVTVAFSLGNVGLAPTTNLVATLLSSGGVTLPSGPQSYGALDAGGGTASRLFTFIATGSCGGTNVATLQLQDGTNDLGTVSFAFRLGKQRVVLSENFDSVTPPALPPGWTVSWSGDGAPWRTTSSRSDTPPNAVFAPDPYYTSDNALISPSVPIATTSAQLTFRHSYDTESCCDYGLLEISIAGGAFTEIIAAGGSFVTGGYDGYGWRGYSGGFITTAVNLPAAAAGKNVRLRWHFTSDYSAGYDGWYIDSISLTEGFDCCATVPNDLAVTIADSPDPVLLGGTLTYTIKINNTGPAPAAGVSVTDVLPASFTLRSIIVSQNVQPGPQPNGGGTLAFSLGTLAGGSNATVTIVGTADSAGLITNRVTVSRTDTDGNPTNNTATEVTTVVLPSLSINDVSLYEGDNGTSNAVFTVSLWPPPCQTATVNFATSNLTALAGADYMPTAGTLTFAPGVTNRAIAVPVLGDTLNESNETFTVNLWAPTNALLGNSQGLGTILNDDPMPRLSIGDAAVAEGNLGTTNAVFTVGLSPASGQTVTVDYETFDGTAAAGSDYASTYGRLTFAPGVTSQTATVTVRGDRLVEPSETFYVDIYSSANAKIARDEAIGTIVNDDGLPGHLHHFAWSAISPTQSVDVPFAVTLTAQDYFGSTLSNFDGTVALSGWSVIRSGATNILFYEDYVHGHYFRTALNELGLSYQAFGEGMEAAFNMALASAAPNTTLVIVDSANSPHDFSAVATFVNAGGRAIFEYWNLDAAPSVATAFDASVAADMSTPAPVYDWGGSQLLAGLPNPVNFVETSWLDDGDRLNPITGGTAVAGYVNSRTSDQAALIVGNSGRTILNGFMLDNAQSSANAVRLAKNEIEALYLRMTAVTIVPTNSDSFTNGVWNGSMTARQVATNVTLWADDGQGHSATSNPFDVGPPRGQLHHFAWSAIPSPQPLGEPFAVTLTAQDHYNGIVSNFNGTVALSSSVPVSPITSGNFSDGFWSGSVKVLQLATNATLRADDGQGHTGTSIPFDVARLPGHLDHFAWSAVPSPQLTGVPFAVTIMAHDHLGNVVTNFTGSASLSGWTGSNPIEDFESGTWPHSPWVTTGTPVGSLSPAHAHDGDYGLGDPNWTYRTDLQIGNPGDLLSAWIRPTGSASGRAYLGFAASASGCWSVVAAPNSSQLILQQNAGYGTADRVVVAQSWQANKWYKLVIQSLSTTSVSCQLYDSDGTTLLNSLSYGSVTGLPGGVAMRSFGGFSLDTIGRGMDPEQISISPTNSGSFVAGTWSGEVAVLQAAMDMSLYAEDGLGNSGQSLPFDVVSPPILSIARAGDSVVLSWPVSPAGFTLERTAQFPLQTDWVSVPDIPVVVGDQNTVTNALSGDNMYYRLKKL